MCFLASSRRASRTWEEGMSRGEEEEVRRVVSVLENSVGRGGKGLVLLRWVERGRGGGNTDGGVDALLDLS